VTLPQQGVVMLFDSEHGRAPGSDKCHSGLVQHLDAPHIGAIAGSKDHAQPAHAVHLAQASRRVVGQVEAGRQLRVNELAFQQHDGLGE